MTDVNSKEKIATMKVQLTFPVKLYDRMIVASSELGNVSLNEYIRFAIMKQLDIDEDRITKLSTSPLRFWTTCL